VHFRRLGPLLAVLVLLGLATPAPASADTGPVVRVGTEGTYPPFSFVDPRTQDLTGFDIEVMRAVCKQAGWQVSFVQTQFDAIFPALDSGRIDAIANQITINPDRQARYLFSTPYTYSHGVVVVAADNDDIHSLKDLKGKTAAENETSNWADVARGAGADVKSIDQFSQAAALLKQGRVDAIVNDNIAVLDYLASTKDKSVKIVANAGDEVGEQALAFRQDEPQLQQQADAALKKLRDDGTLASISKKYFGTDVTVKDQDQSDLDVKGSDTRSTAEIVKDAVWPMFKGLLRGTLPLTVIAFVVGMALALAAALARMSSSWWLSLPARFYISVIRGTPLLVQLFIVFYGLPQLGLKIPSFPAAAIALSLNVGGYAAEIIRASILSVPRGQFEAATTIGMHYPQAMRRIILPQAARIAVPPLSNTLLSLIKDTSLASVVLVPEVLKQASNAASSSGQFLPLYALAALYYWVVCWLVSLAQQRLEVRLERYAV
jgi:His/Glu/Gln/Arg/opine family amino acid ABC transporter permease subunit